MESNRSFILITTLAILFFVIPIKTQAASSAVVTATVSISQCGNGIVESGESCDRILQNNISCGDYGFNGGSVFCDKKCRVDFSKCVFSGTTDTKKVKIANVISPKVIFTISGLLGVLMILRGISILAAGKNFKPRTLLVKPAWF